MGTVSSRLCIKIQELGAGIITPTTMHKLILIAFLGVCLASLVSGKAKHDCDCDYHPGGCLISVAAPEGFKCRCVYRGAWTCRGYAVGCDEHEMHLCKGNCYSRTCCMIGNGDCGAY